MRRITKCFLPVLGTIAVATAMVAQEVTPVWVQHINELINVAPENKMPVLVKAGGTGDNTYGFSGRDVIDSYVNLLKYDDNLYLLGIRENGINEDDPGLSQELRDRAAAYPDRSIIWIDAATGKPLGIALKTDIVPVPLAAPSKAQTYAWWKWGIQDGEHGQRAIYTGYQIQNPPLCPGCHRPGSQLPQWPCHLVRLSHRGLDRTRPRRTLRRRQQWR